MANATMFGFKLDRVALHHGLTHTNQPFADARLEGEPGENFVQSLETIRPHLVGVTRTGTLKYNAPADEAQDTSRATGGAPPHYPRGINADRKFTD